VFDKWRYPAALATAIGIAFPALALAAGPEAPAKQARDSGKPAATQVHKRPISRPAELGRPGAHLRTTIQVQVKEIRAEQRKHRNRWRPLPGGISQSTLDAIGECESGGDPNAVSAGGTYRGKYQFDYGTWESVGGDGDPAAASESEQDYRAALLYSRSGSSPWPNCA
jgi:transglycosylase-like protein